MLHFPDGKHGFSKKSFVMESGTIVFCHHGNKEVGSWSPSNTCSEMSVSCENLHTEGPETGTERSFLFCYYFLLTKLRRFEISAWIENTDRTSARSSAG